MISYRYDRDADALDIRLREVGEALVARTEQVDEGTLVDLDQDGAVIAIEVLRPARRWPLEEILERYAIDDQSAEILRSHWREPGRYPFADPSDVGAGADAGELVLA
jgi:uncharacterized protein YuzE